MDEVTFDWVNHSNIVSRSEIMAGLRVMIKPLINILSVHRTFCIELLPAMRIRVAGRSSDALFGNHFFSATALKKV